MIGHSGRSYQKSITGMLKASEGRVLNTAIQDSTRRVIQLGWVKLRWGAGNPNHSSCVFFALEPEMAPHFFDCI